MKKIFTFLIFSFTIVVGIAQTRKDNISEMYNMLIKHEIFFPDIVLTQAVVETGWFECNNCSREYNNYFGFRTNKGYLRFENMEECVKYMKRWQDKYYIPWKVKHTNGTYYDFLKYIRYAADMDNYVAYLIRLERDIKNYMGPELTMN